MRQTGQAWTLAPGWAGGTRRGEHLQAEKQHSEVMTTTENLALSNKRVACVWLKPR